MTRSRQIAIAGALTAGAALAMAALAHPLGGAAVAVLPIGLIAVVLALGWPFELCLAFVVFSFFRIHEAFPVLMPLRIPNMLALLTLAALAWGMVGRRSIRPSWSSELTVFGLFFLHVTAGVLLATDRPTAMAYWSATYVKIGIMLVAISWLTRGPRDFGRASAFFVAAGLLIAGVTLSNKVQGIGLVEGTRVTIGRDIQSVLGDPNDLSLVLLFPLAFAVSQIATRGTGGLHKLGSAIVVPLILSAIIATQSRGGLLGAMAVFAVFGVRKVRSKLLLAAVGTIAAVVLYAVAGISDRQSGGAGEEGIDESAMGRVHAWGAAIRMATSHPMFGVGLDNFVGNYFFYSDFWDGKNHAVHSTWFGVLGETGIPGIALFIALVVMTARTALRASRTLDAVDAPAPSRALGHALVAGLAGLCTSATFLTQGFTWPIYIHVALTVALARHAAALSGNAARGDQDAAVSIACATASTISETKA